MTFLEICQQVASDSGTFPGDNEPATVAGQTGRELVLVSNVQRAWKRIQAKRVGWLFLRDTFSGVTEAGTRRYTGNVSRFGRFLTTRREDEDRWSIYKTADGRSEEAELIFRDPELFYRYFERGDRATEQGKPQYFTIDWDGALKLAPIPDGIYTIRGPYQKTAQELLLDADVPDMPADYHELIVYETLIFMANRDETNAQMPLWMQERDRLFTALVRDQLPAITTGGALDQR